MLIALLMCVSAHAQTTKTGRAPQDPLQQHYEAAQHSQAAGDLERASAEYRRFLSEALHRLGSRRAAAGDFARAAQLLQEALDLAPSDSALRLDYAQACLAANDPANARSAAEGLVDSEPQNAKAHFVLAQILSRLGENEVAKDQLENAVAIDPNFENGYALAIAYLKLLDPDHAAKIFSEMLAGFGDTAQIHMDFGRAYAQAGFPEQAIQEFKKAVEKDNKLPGAHYSLGAAYLVGLAESALPEAAAEFRQELKNHPDDFFSLCQLGNISLKQHKMDEAEGELTHAAALDSENPDAFLFLGQVYFETDRRAEAEKALRRAISLTKDVSRNHYQVQRAHYLLGKLLLQTDRTEEGRQELKMADELLRQSLQVGQGNIQGGVRRLPNDIGAAAQVQETRPAQRLDPEALKEAEAFEKRIGPAIADSYNNLGAIAASRSDLTTALSCFRKSAAWNPSLEGLDYNWGRAAFLAKDYEQTIAPLARHLQTHPEDAWSRAALGWSFFAVKKYREALETLRPIETQITPASPLSYIYAVSLVKSGDFDLGVSRLEDLEKANPRAANIPAALGEAFASRGDHGRAADEFRQAVQLDPSDMNFKHQLAVSLIQLQQKEEAQALLSEAIRRGSRDADVYYQLGKLQLEKGEVKAAIVNLEMAAKISPSSGEIHYELAVAYRRDSRTEDAEREMKLYEAIRSQHTGTNEPPKTN